MCVIFGDRDRTEDFCLKFCGASLQNFSLFRFVFVDDAVCSDGSHQVLPQSGTSGFWKNSNSVIFQQILGLDSISRRCSSPPFHSMLVFCMIAHTSGGLKSGSLPSSDKSTLY